MIFKLSDIYSSKFKFELIKRPNNNGNEAIESVSNIELIKLKKMFIFRLLKFFLFKNFLYILSNIYKRISVRFNNNLSYPEKTHDKVNKLNHIIYSNIANKTNKIPFLLKKEKIILNTHEHYFYETLTNVYKNLEIDENKFTSFFKKQINSFSDKCILNLYFYFSYHSCYKLAYSVYRHFYLRNKNDLSTYDKFISNFIFSENKEIFSRYFKERNKLNIFNLFFTKKKIQTKNDLKNHIFSDKKIFILGPKKINFKNFNSKKDINFIRFNLNEKNYISYKDKNTIINDSISFYNGSNIKAICESPGVAPYKSLRYIFCRFNKFTEKKKKEIENKYKINLLFIENTKSFFLNNLTGLSTALIEILQFQPKKIKIFNCDFMLSSNRLPNYYPENERSNYNDNILKWGRGSVGHNILLQFAIAKKIYELGKIEGDEIFTETVNLDFKDYMTKMHNNHYFNR